MSGSLLIFHPAYEKCGLNSAKAEFFGLVSCFLIYF